MTFTLPTLDEDISAIKKDIETELPGETAPRRRRLKSALAVALGFAVFSTRQFMAYMLTQMNPVTATGVWLQAWARFFGIVQKQATFASRNIIAVGNGTVAAGQILTDEDGVVYTVVDEFAAVGTGAGVVVCEEAGTIGNLAAATVLTFVGTVAGIDPEATVDDEDPGVDGVDAETEEELRSRLLFRMANPPQGGAPSDYVAWALEVPGVTRAWAYKNNRGLGTIDVTFVRDNDVDGGGNPDIIPSESERAAVEAHILAKMPGIADCEVFLLTAEPLSPTIDNIVLESGATEAATEEAINAEWKEMIRRYGEPETNIKRSKMIEATSIAAGEDNHELTLPAGDHVVGTGKIATLGTVTCNFA